jgi:hypothetical protein
MTQTISHGNRPLTPKTAMRMPHVRNHRRAFVCMVARTSALMIALSMLVIDSKTARPRMVKTAEVMSIVLLRNFYASCIDLLSPEPGLLIASGGFAGMTEKCFF